MNILSISVVDLLANLLGESEVNGLTSWSSKLCDTLLLNFDVIHDFWDSDALFSSKVFTTDDDEINWFVDTGLDRLRVGNLNSGLNRSDNRYIVASFLGNLLAVVVSVAVISVSWSWLAHSDHLSVTLLLVRNFNSLGSCGFSLLLVRVSTDLIINNSDTLSTDSASNRVALFLINNHLCWNLNVFTDSFESWSADFSRLNNINNGTVMFWFLVSIMWLMVDWSMMDNSMVNWGMDSMVDCRSMMNNWGMDSMVDCRSMVNNWGMVNSWSMVDHWSVHSRRGMCYKGSTCKSSKRDCRTSSCQSDKCREKKNLKISCEMVKSRNTFSTTFMV